jgi:hypothetical protein
MFPFKVLRYFHINISSDSVEATIRNTIVTDSLIIHELDNRLLDAVCLDTEDNSVSPLERSLTLSDKGEQSLQGQSPLMR